ncbi:MAG: hypothetical protein ACTSPC_02445 [Candidatus Heimdallarchaeota archaeon]
MAKMFFNDKIVKCSECSNDDFLCRVDEDVVFILCRKCNHQMMTNVSECLYKGGDFYSYS